MGETWPYIAAGSLALLGIIFGLRRGYVNINTAEVTPNDENEAIRAGLRYVMDVYGREYAENIERLIRWETAHFTSKQWKQGNTAGMESTAPNFPYGWSSLETWADLNGIAPDQFSTYKMIENNTNISKDFIRFPSVYAFIAFLAWFIKNRRSGRMGYWYSLNETNAVNYENKISKVIPRIVNEL